ncbi:hypothetical protein SAMN05444159_6840 [Bradyrhizobium lablabi]|uniref:RCK C-terminal domain-containing protein n=1 Tax=Bradyrhizobium lablabi TaxID=722472 RepID=A0A1M7DJE8_9BRAD|nr:hypothetical protein SAMN05444159_6840 [Bradyrhizobium lablabi]
MRPSQSGWLAYCLRIICKEPFAKSRGANDVIQINRRDGDVFTAPPATTVVGEGDGVVLIGRPNRADLLTSLFEPRLRGARG